MVIDYLSGHEDLRDFYEHRPDIAGIKKAIELKKKQYTQRNLLCKELQHQYAHLSVSQPVMDNLNALQEENTFTVCTAHQPCLFTGPLYFIYKILHACKLAAFLNEQLPEFRFVPVYYMGTEDADLEELGTIQVHGKKYQWDTTQKGAVGRMLVDESLLAMIDELDRQLVGSEKAKANMSLLRRCYQKGISVARATFLLVNELFQQYGLLVLNPDNAALKRTFIPVLEKELKEGFSQKALHQTIERFPAQYKVQSAGRPINLFYLKDQQRTRIKKTALGHQLAETEGHFTEEEMMSALYAQPECFSPNVILRPLLQEHLLPNVAFIGGGGELAYWLELKEVFNQVAIPYPVLVLRNSFALLTNKSNQALASLELTAADFFMKEHELQKKWILKKEDFITGLTPAIHSLEQSYKIMQQLAAKADVTLQAHVAALQKNAEKKLLQLEKKILRAQKKKHEAGIAKIKNLYALLYPGGALQERMENYLGIDLENKIDLLELLYTNSKPLDQLFCFIALQ